MIKFVSASKAIVTKEFMKKASIYGTREYKLLREFKLENPKIEVEVKTRTRAVCKTRNATYAKMREYLETLSDSMKAILEFEKMVARSVVQPNPYKFILSWFDATYPNARSTFEAEEVKETSEAEDAALSA